MQAVQGDHSPELNFNICQFFYGAHSFTYQRTILQKNYGFLLCHCLRSSHSAPLGPLFSNTIKIQSNYIF